MLTRRFPVPVTLLPLSLFLFLGGCGQRPSSLPVAASESTPVVADQSLPGPTTARPASSETAVTTTVPIKEITAKEITVKEVSVEELSAEVKRSEHQETPPAKPASFRNPFQPPTVTVRTVTPRELQTADIRLLGIAKREMQRFAILENGGELAKASVGDMVRDWEVVKIGDTQVILRRNLEEIQLQLD